MPARRSYLQEYPLAPQNPKQDPTEEHCAKRIDQRGIWRVETERQDQDARAEVFVQILRGSVGCMHGETVAGPYTRASATKAAMEFIPKTRKGLVHLPRQS